MKVRIDRQYCTGSGLCEVIEPRVFLIAGDGLASVRAEDVPAECEATVTEASQSCPGGCIRVSATQDPP